MTVCYYVACPYKSEDLLVTEWRLSQVQAASRWLMQSGDIHVFCPVLHSHWLGLEDWDWSRWSEWCSWFLSRSDGLVVVCLRGWEDSRGVSWERRFAESNGKPIWYLSRDDSGFKLSKEPGGWLDKVSDDGCLLTFGSYQGLASSTAIYGAIGDKTTYPLLGLAGEVGELLNKVKKLWRDGRGAVVEARENRELREELEFELGDILWYLSQVASEFDLSLSEVAMRNLKKLHMRHWLGTLSGSGDHR